MATSQDSRCCSAQCLSLPRNTHLCLPLYPIQQGGRWSGAHPCVPMQCACVLWFAECECVLSFDVFYFISRLILRVHGTLTLEEVAINQAQGMAPTKDSTKTHRCKVSGCMKDKITILQSKSSSYKFLCPSKGIKTVLKMPRIRRYQKFSGN